MGRRKLDKFRDNETSFNIVQPGKEIFGTIRGNWHSLYFQNQRPLVLELGCGRGEYTVGLARLFPDKNVVGIDIKGSRIWNGSQAALKEGLKNAAFLRIQLQQLDQYFNEDEVDDIWITFPDPRPRDRDERRRLTNPRFLNMYNRLLKSGGWVHLKTDNTQLFMYTLEVLSTMNNIGHLEHTEDLYSSSLVEDHYGLQTTYEKKFLAEGISIKYLRFQFTNHAVK